MKVVLDFETASFANLKITGADRYAQDPNTEVLSLVYHTTDDKQYWLWTPDKDDGLLHRLAADPDVQFVCFAGFEQAIWRWIMSPIFGFAPIPINRWVDMQSVCALHAVPIDLDHALSVMDIPVVKDLEGRRVTLALSRFDPKTGMLPTRTQAMMEKVYDYNRVDVVGTSALLGVFGDLPADERRVWEIDQEINQRGIRVDLPLVSACQRLVARGVVPLLQEFREITGVNPTQGKKFLAWLGERGVDLPNLKKETVAAILGEGDDDEIAQDGSGFELHLYADLPGDARRALYIRSLVGSASVKKLPNLAASVCTDGRIRGQILYHGATTGRWVGRGSQPQNFPRGSVVAKPAVKIAAIMRGATDGEIEREFECNPVELVKSSLRHTLVPSAGCDFVSGDYAQIEARMVLALAGQVDKCELLASGASPYCEVATKIFGRKITKCAEDLAEYTTGKNTFLGCGFQMGWKTYRDRYCPDKAEEFAKDGIKAYRTWAPMVPKLWAGLETAALNAVYDPAEQAHWYRGIGYKIQWIGGKRFLVCRLLDGKHLYYFDPRPCRKEMPWSTDEKPDIRRAWKYRAKRLGQWKWIDAYGGILTENVVQALARQLLCRAMERLSTAGWPIVLTVHDEVLCEMPTGKDWTDELEAILCEDVGWAAELRVPIAVETWQGSCYRK